MLAAARLAPVQPSRTSVTSSKKRGSSRVSTVRGSGRSMSTIARDAPRPRAHHDDARREEDGLGDRVRDEDDRRAASPARSAAARRFSRSRVISSSAPNGSSIRRSAGSKESARAIETRCCMPPESCHGWWSPKPCSSTRSSISADPLRSLAPSPSRASRAAARCSSRPCASRRGRRPGRRCRSRGRGAPAVRGLPLTRHVPVRRLDQVADDAQERRLAAAGRADQRDELARLDLEVDVLQRDGAALELFVTPLIATARHATCSGARRTTSFSATTTTRKKTIPRSAAMMFVAQRSCGSNV